MRNPSDALQTFVFPGSTTEWMDPVTCMSPDSTKVNGPSHVHVPRFHSRVNGPSHMHVPRFHQSEWTQSGNRDLVSVFVQSSTSDSKRQPGIGQMGSPDSWELYPWIWVITTEMECNGLYYMSIKGLILIQLKYKAERVWDISENKSSFWIIPTTQGKFRTSSCTLVCKGHVISNTQLVVPCIAKWKLMPKYLKDC